MIADILFCCYAYYTRFAR